MLSISANSLAGARFAFDHRIDSFEVARVRREPDLDLGAGSKPAYCVIAEMIFYVAIAGDQIRNVILGELGEDRP